MKKVQLTISFLLLISVLLIGCRVGLPVDINPGNPVEMSYKAHDFEIGIKVYKDDFYCIPSVSYTDERGETLYLSDLENSKKIDGPWFTLTIPDNMEHLRVELDSNSYGFTRELTIVFDNDKNEEYIHNTITQFAADAEL